MVRCVPPDPQFTTAAARDAWLVVQRGLGPRDVLLANLRLTEAEGDHEAVSRARDLLVVCGDPAQIRAVGGEGVVRRLAGPR